MAKKLQVFGVIDPKGVVQSVNGINADENGNVNIEIPESVPATTDPHMQLVTDANGEKKWEERTHYATTEPALDIKDLHFNVVDGYVDSYSVPELKNIRLVTDGQYKVTLDGEEYDCVAVGYDDNIYLGNFMLVGGPSNEIPFLIYCNCNGTAIGLVDGTTGEHTLSITGVIPTYYPLNERYLPHKYVEYIKWDDFGVDGDTFREVIRRINNDEPVSVNWSKDMGRIRQAYYRNDSMDVIFEEDPFTIYKFNHDEETYSSYNNAISSPNEMRADSFVFRIEGGTRGEGFVVKSTRGQNGTKVFQIMGDGTMFIHSSTEGSSKMFKVALDDSGTPFITEADNGELAVSIPAISTASPGQTIVVKSVDENGKPTGWESASLPSKVSDLANDAGYLTEHQDLSAKVTLPTSNGTPNHGTAGQFAVSDGNGGIMWKTLVEAEEVSY